MMKRLFPSFRRIGRDESGTSIVELGLFLPFMMVLIVGMVDLGMGISSRLALQKAVDRTLALASTHTFEADEDPQDVDYDFLIADAAAAAGVEEDNVFLDKWLECDGVEQPEYEGTCAEDEAIARYIQLRAEKNYTPMFGLSLAGGAGSIPLFAEAALRVQ